THLLALSAVIVCLQRTAAAVIHTLSLHDALPISRDTGAMPVPGAPPRGVRIERRGGPERCITHAQLASLTRRPRGARLVTAEPGDPRPGGKNCLNQRPRAGRPLRRPCFGCQTGRKEPA